MITRPDSRSAFIEYSVPLDTQIDGGLSEQFVVQYDVKRARDGGEVLVYTLYN